MADDRAKAILKTYERRKGDRGTTESHWQQTANYSDPNRADYITERSPGSKRMQYVFDQTPLWSLGQFTAGLDSLMTSATVQWFYLRTDDERLNRNPDVKMWLDAAAAAMYAIFNSPRHNFASQAQQLYSDCGLIGTACQGVLESRKSGILFSTYHMKECVVAESDEDRIDTNIRRWQWTAGQAFAMWGADAGEKVAKAAMDNPDQKFWFLHCVQPRRKRDPDSGDNLNMAFESVYIAEADQTIISESGFAEFPFMVPRLTKVTGEIYGRGLAMTALPDIKMLMEAVKLTIQGAQLLVRPVMDVPDNGYIMPLRSQPGSYIFRRSGMRPEDRMHPVQTGAQPEFGDNMVKDLRNSIMRTFLVDLLRMPTDLNDPNSDGKGSTATYWLQRREKEMLQLAPMFARMQAEFLGPLIDRVFAILWRKSKMLRFGPGSPFPPPPQALSGVTLRPEYVSPIAIAQKSSQLDSVQVLMQRQMMMRQIDPECPIYLDMEEIMRLTADDNNAPAGAVKSAQVLQQEAQQRAEVQQAQAQHMQAQGLASAFADGTKGIKNLADAGQSGAGNDDSQQEAA